MTDSKDNQKKKSDDMLPDVSNLDAIEREMQKLGRQEHGSRTPRAQLGAMKTNAENVRPMAFEEVFPSYASDSENPTGSLLFVIENGALVSSPETATEYQRKGAEWLAKITPNGNRYELSQTEISNVLKQFQMKHNAAGYATSQIPMLCQGALCPMVRDKKAVTGQGRDLSKCSCTLYAAGIHPLGRECPLELAQDASLRRSLYEALEIDPNTSNIHAHLIGNLVAWMIVQSRLLMEMGQDPFLVVDREFSAVPVGGGGVHSINREIMTPRVEALEICQRNIDSLRKQLLATPEAQAKVSGNSKSPTGATITVKAQPKKLLIEDTKSSVNLLEE